MYLVIACRGLFYLIADMMPVKLFCKVVEAFLPFASFYKAFWVIYLLVPQFKSFNIKYVDFKKSVGGNGLPYLFI